MQETFFFFPGNGSTVYLVIVLRSCSRCGAEAKPDDTFCGRCGSQLEPDLPDSGGEPSLQDKTLSPPEGATGKRSSRSLLAVAVLIIAVLISIIAGYLLLTGSGTLPSGSKSSPAGTGNQSGNAQSISYVIVETEEPTQAITTLPVTTASPVPTALITISPTTLKVSKTVVCPSDRLKCNDGCVDMKTDRNNCGTCSTTCTQNQTCINGNCMKSCSSGQTSCQDGCFDIQSDPDHCGSCLNNCPAGLICSRGQCTAPDTPMPVPV